MLEDPREEKGKAKECKGKYTEFINMINQDTEMIEAMYETLKATHAECEQLNQNNNILLESIRNLKV
eukprot:CAMPEP_0116909660 /NCGR_PEP_ID=MMETSP0467-20121206/14406_1 /TAXON_ID=283647 /ORGANISM="Mesodinium pulex, Strain SPMC105" /LENGTH=66 /DNA_ID=CAMNT_0004585057 /DNA_START=876 /DNA_END=1076 /DNA_ORIENTATION=-